MKDHTTSEVQLLTGLFVVLAAVGVTASVWPAFDAFLSMLAWWGLCVLAGGLLGVLARELWP